MAFNCICEYGKDLPVGTSKCPKCGMNLEPLSRVHSLANAFEELENTVLQTKESDALKEVELHTAARRALRFRRILFVSVPVLVFALLILTVISFSREDSAEQANENSLAYYENYYRSELLNTGEFAGIMVSSDSLIHVHGELGQNEVQGFWKILLSSDLLLSQIDISDVSITNKEPHMYELTYIIRSGESLSEIAYSIYGDYSEWEGLYEANKDRIHDPDKILTGTIITIPISD